MNRLGTLLLFALLVFLGYRLCLLLEKVATGKIPEQKQAEKSKTASSALPGMPPELEASWELAARGGVATMSNWLSFYGPRVKDPRLASIQLDYCERLAWVNPAEARRLFAEISSRTPTNSPVYPRIRQLAPAFK